MADKNYCVYHLHSDMSNGVTNIDSVTKFQDYIDKAKELGMTAMGFSEHGSVFAWDTKKEAIEKASMKYIHAEEFYITKTLNERIRDNYHCVLIAKNWEGVKELNKLSSISFNRQDNHFYYVPRISIDELFNTSSNIIITSACIGGIYGGEDRELKNRFFKFMTDNKDRCFLEIQHHNVDKQKEYNQMLSNIATKYDLRLIAGTDTHCLNSWHSEGRVMLQKAKNIYFENEEGWDLTFKSYDELVEAYKLQGVLAEEVYLQAIENTNVMADMVETFELDRHTKYPHIYNNPLETFKRKINEGYKDKKDILLSRHSKEDIFNRIKEELDVYDKVGAIDFMLLESYIREWEKENGIQSGYGRGSVSGSLIAYILGITQMDSLKFNLNFFRFMNPSRVSNADIDTDYANEDRDKIKYFLLHDKLNLPNIKTAEIITFNTVAMKGTIKELARALGLSLDEAQSISNAVEQDENKNWVIDDLYRKRYPELFKYVDLLMGVIVSIGSHPSGVLVSDLDIEENVGLCSIKGSDYPVSMIDMHGLDNQMYIKLDALGLDSIGVINDCCKLVGVDRLTPDNVNLNDEKVWRSIREDTTMIFQWESDSAQDYLKRFMSDETLKIAKEHNQDFSYIKWFSFGNGLIRPGCASFRDEISNGNILLTGFKELDDFLAITFGRVTMQEDIMRFCKQFCGYSDAESDTVRRAIAKKKGTANLLDELHDRFLKYSHETYGVEESKLEEIFPPIKQGILDASAYAFSWNHSDAYSCIGYISGYLRYYYPLEFLTAAFNVFNGKMEKIKIITEYAKKINILIKDIKFRYSKGDYTLDKENNTIYKGISSIKYMNNDVADKLYEMRNNTFNSFIDLIKVFPGNSRQLDILIKLNFFEEFGDIGKLLSIVKLYNGYYDKKIIKKENCEIDEDIILNYATETDKQYKITDTNGLFSELLKDIKPVNVSIGSRCKWENEFLGYINITDTTLKDEAFIVDVDTKYSPKISIYKIDTGEILTVKISKKDYQRNPIQKDDRIKFITEERNRMIKDESGNWIETDNKDLWLKWYAIHKEM